MTTTATTIAPFVPQPAIARRPSLRQAVKLRLFRLGLQTWGTKSFEFWTLLMATLAMVRPASIVEFGSGRSSSYLGEYAQKTGARYVSVEQNRFFARRIRRALRLGLVNPAPITHVPVQRDDAWYDADRLHRAVDFAPECLFIDGPVGTQEQMGRGERTAPRALAWYAQAMRSIRVLLVDDAHRRANLALAHELLAQRPDLKPIYIAYEPRPGTRNVVLLALPEPDLARLRRLAAELNIAVLPHYSHDQCTENQP